MPETPAAALARAADKVRKWFGSRLDDQAMDISRLYRASRDRFTFRLRQVYDAYLADDPTLARARLGPGAAALNRAVDETVEGLSRELGDLAVARLQEIHGWQPRVLNRFLRRASGLEFAELPPSAQVVLGELTTRVVGGGTFLDRVTHQSEELRQDLYGGLRQALLNGDDFNAVRARVHKLFGVDKLDEPEGPTYGSVKLYRNEALRQWNLLMGEKADETGGVEVWWTIVEGPESRTTTPGCAARHARPITEIGDRPPRHWNCVPGWTNVAGDVVAAMRFSYNGPLVHLKTRQGRTLTATPNHPILTARGFVFAAAMQEGDRVLCRAGDIKRLNGVYDEQHAPTSIEQVFETLRARARAYERALVADDFYGDAACGQRYVEVVTTEPELMAHSAHGAAERPDQGRFVGAGTTAEPARAQRSLSGSDARGWIVASSPALPCLGELVPDHIPESGHQPALRPLQTLGVGATAEFDAAFLETVRQHAARDMRVVAQRLQRGAAEIASEQGGDVNGPPSAPTADLQGRNPRCATATPCTPHGFSARADRHVEVLEALVNAPIRAADFAHDLVERLPALITLDDIVRVEMRSFSGHVYDLQTTTGLMIADGLLTKQCRCQVLVVPRGTDLSDERAKADAWLGTHGYTRRSAAHMEAAREAWVPTVTAEFDPAEHPRAPKGAAGGGQFVPKGAPRAPAFPPRVTSRRAAPVGLGRVDPASGRRALQPVDDADALLGGAEAARRPFTRVLRDLVGPGSRVVGVRAKARDSLMRKVALGKPAHTISDYLGARLSVDSRAESDRLVRGLERRGFRVLEDQDFLDQPKLGYRARHLQVALPNGMTAEVQIVPREIVAVQDRAHREYDVARRPGMPATMRLEAMRRSQEIFDAAWRRADPRRWARRALPVAAGDAEALQGLGRGGRAHQVLAHLRAAALPALGRPGLHPVVGAVRHEADHGAVHEGGGPDRSAGLQVAHLAPSIAWGRDRLLPLYAAARGVPETGRYASVPWRDLPALVVGAVRPAPRSDLAQTQAAGAPDHVLLRPRGDAWEALAEGGWRPLRPRGSEARWVETARGFALDAPDAPAWDAPAVRLPLDLLERWPAMRQVVLPSGGTYAVSVVPRDVAEAVTMGQAVQTVAWRVGRDLGVLVRDAVDGVRRPVLMLRAPEGLDGLRAAVDMTTGEVIYAAEEFPPGAEAPYRRVAVAALEPDGQVWAVRPRGKPFWALPGGHLEPGEAPAEAAGREMAEETGVRVRLDRSLGRLYRPWATTEVFLGRRVGRPEAPATADEVDAVAVVPVADLEASERAFLVTRNLGGEGSRGFSQRTSAQGVAVP